MAESIREILDRCEFGFKLTSSGKYQAVVRSHPVGWRKFIEPSKEFDGFNCWAFPFTEFIEDNLGFSFNFKGMVEFISGIAPDCSKFAKHSRGPCYDEAIDSWYSKYDRVVEWRDPDTHEAVDMDTKGAIRVTYYKKYFSVEEFKELIVHFVEKYIEEHKDVVGNVKKYNEKGSVFVRCK